MSDDSKIKQRVALISIGVSVLLTVSKLVAAVASGSLALFSEAGNNFADTCMTVITYFAIRVADKPADEEHQFGHGKVEALAALAETGFLFALAAYILIEAVKRLLHHDAEVDANWLAFGVLIVSIVVDFFRWRSLSRVAKQTKSDALAADALNFSSDIFASTLALLGLVAARFGYPQGDAIAAFAVAIFIGVAGTQLARRTVDTLLDAAPKGITEPIRGIVQGVPGVIDVANLRLRPAGAEVFGDIAIKVSRTLSQENVATIKDNVAAAIAAAYPEVRVTVATEPIALDDESVLERIRLIAGKRHVPVHHVTVQEVGGRTSISFDVEVDGRMPHGAAHDIVSGLERAVRAEFGADIEVDSHIEPLEPRELEGRDVSAETQAEVAAALQRRAPETGGIFDVHSVRVRQTVGGLVVNYHCRVDPTQSVDVVHDRVDDLDRKLRTDFAAIVRIVGHADPLKTG